MKPNDSEKVFLWVLGVIGAVAIGWLFLIGNSHAAVRRMSEAHCAAITNDIYVIAQMRDLQKDRDEVAKLVEQVLSPHLGEEDSYIQYQSDIQLMVDLVAPIYESKMTAEQIAETMYANCKNAGFGVNEV
jgi:hypothetical protein